MDDYPLPHAADALEPFIKPRDEVSEIRQGLQTYLERHLALDGQPLSVANAFNPPLSRALAEPPAGVTGVRKAYWRALRAHQAAQFRYETLKDELAQNLEGEARAMSNVQSTPAATDLLPLMRQRERRRKLTVLESAVSSIEAEGSGLAGAGVDDFVRARVGEVPVPPSQNGFSSQQEGRKVEVDERLVQLKKAVLSAKRVADENQHDASMNGGVSGTLSHNKSESYALQQARNELITWIEKQLALIGEGQGGEDEDTTGDESMVGGGVPREEIAQLYSRYIHARRQILQTLDSPLEPTLASPSSPLELRKSSGIGTEITAAASLAVAALPYAQNILSTKRKEEARLQQAAYARQQLALAEAEADRELRRLADESHLVHPGASKGADWAAAASESSTSTKRFVEIKVKTGQLAAGEADIALGSIGKMPETLRNL